MKKQNIDIWNSNPDLANWNIHKMSHFYQDGVRHIFVELENKFEKGCLIVGRSVDDGSIWDSLIALAKKKNNLREYNSIKGCIENDISEFKKSILSSKYNHLTCAHFCESIDGNINYVSSPFWKDCNCGAREKFLQMIKIAGDTIRENNHFNIYNTGVKDESTK